MTLRKRPLHLKSLTALLLIVFLGCGLIFAAYYVMSFKTIKDNKALTVEIEQLNAELEGLSAQHVRLSKSPFPTDQELFRYATMIPNNPETLRFLRSIDTIANATGLQIDAVQLNEEQPISTDILNKLLAILQERSLALTTAENSSIGSDLIDNLLTQMNEQSQNSAAGSTENAAQAPVDEDSLKRVMVNLEYRATDDQVLQFLQSVRQLERITYIDTMQIDRDNQAADRTGSLKSSLQMTIFYYEGDFPFIPSLQ